MLSLSLSLSRQTRLLQIRGSKWISDSRTLQWEKFGWITSSFLAKMLFFEYLWMEKVGTISQDQGAQLLNNLRRTLSFNLSIAVLELHRSNHGYGGTHLSTQGNWRITQPLEWASPCTSSVERTSMAPCSAKCSSTTQCCTLIPPWPPCPDPGTGTASLSWTVSVLNPINLQLSTLQHLRKEQQLIDFCAVCLFPILRHGLSKLRNSGVLWLQMEIRTQFTSSEAELTAMKMPPPWRGRCISTTFPITRGQSALWILPLIKAILVPEASQEKYVILHHVCLCLHCLSKSLVSLWRFCDNCFAQGGFGVFPSRIRSHISFVKTRKRGICATNEEVSILDFPSEAKL